MSSSENISLWKKKAEIDYIPIFMSLWLSFNAWMRDRIEGNSDRGIIDYLKTDGLNLKSKFAELMHQENAKAHKFRADFAELYRALNNADIHYTHEKLREKKVSFENCIIDWKGGNSRLESIKATKGEEGGNHGEGEDSQPSSIEIDDELWIDNDNDRVFVIGVITIVKYLILFIFNDPKSIGLCFLK